jgi:hypothetical protein
MHLDMSTPQGPELHLELSGQKEPLLTLVPELDLEVSGKQELVLGWTYLPYRGLNYAWMCLENRSLSWSGQEVMSNSTPWAPQLHLDVSTLQEAFAAPGRVRITGALKCVPWEMYKVLYMEIITEFHKILYNYTTRNSAKFR